MTFNFFQLIPLVAFFSAYLVEVYGFHSCPFLLVFGFRALFFEIFTKAQFFDILTTIYIIPCDPHFPIRLRFIFFYPIHFRFLTDVFHNIHTFSLVPFFISRSDNFSNLSHIIHFFDLIFTFLLNIHCFDLTRHFDSTISKILVFRRNVSSNVRQYVRRSFLILRFLRVILFLVFRCCSIHFLYRFT